MTVNFLKLLLRRAKRIDTPRVSISLDVFGPGDRRVVRLEVGK